jgi:selenocysteine lyase/cysteine desulfurase
MRLATNSLPWKRGDRLAITSAEHIGTIALTRGVEQFTGKNATVIPLGDGKDYSPDRFLDRLDGMLTSDHRMFIISHVTSMDGRRLPLAEATRIARGRGVKVLVDGAQSVGQLPVNVSEIAPDFFVGSLSKWLLGPAGAGYLYVAERQLPKYRPNFAPDTFSGKESDCGLEQRMTAANRTEIGTANRSLRAGAACAIDTVLCIGLSEIEHHNRELTVRLRSGLRQTDGIELVTPYTWEWSSAITSVRLPDFSAAQVEELIKRLRDDYRIVVKYQWDFEGIRICVASFNDEEEVERLLEGLAHLTVTLG